MPRSTATILAVLLAGLFVPPTALAQQASADGLPVRSGQIEFVSNGQEALLSEPFRLEPHTFSFRQEPIESVATQMELSLLTFPSPVVTPHEANNTVHCEYFRPTSKGKHPGVVVLHILGGDFDLARLFCRYLADHQVAALFLKMPYYGPRRQPGVAARMVSEDPRETVAGMRQAVLDIRRAAAWLAAQEEIDPQQLGIFGISLGGITAALAATAEPRFQNVCLLLAGGDVAQVAWSSPEVAELRRRWLASGGSKETFFQLMKSVDPVTYAHHLQGRQVLMLNARRDEVIPRQCTDSLWRALGKPPIVWYDAGHYSAIRFIFDALSRVTRFFQAPGASPPNS